MHANTDILGFTVLKEGYKGIKLLMPVCAYENGAPAVDGSALEDRLFKMGCGFVGFTQELQPHQWCVVAWSTINTAQPYFFTANWSKRDVLGNDQEQEYL